MIVSTNSPRRGDAGHELLTELPGRRQDELLGVFRLRLAERQVRFGERLDLQHLPPDRRGRAAEFAQAGCERLEPVAPAEFQLAESFHRLAAVVERAEPDLPVLRRRPLDGELYACQG